MSYPYSPRSRPTLSHQAASPSPLRHASNASTGSSGNSNATDPPSRSSTVSSHESAGARPRSAGHAHRRGLSESTTRISDDVFGSGPNAAGSYLSMRQKLRPLSQAPVNSPPRSPPPSDSSDHRVHSRSKSLDPTIGMPRLEASVSPPVSPPVSPSKSQMHSLAISRADSVRAPPSRDRQKVHFARLDKPDLKSLQKSTTGHLRTLSKFAEDASDEDFTIKSPDQEVVGMQGRRRLQRGMSQRGKRPTSGWAATRWMDQQRQFLQAYEYLCHIGEAKEWIEDIIQEEIPPVVQLEEALRNGVTLAEVVRALQPDRPLRIFRHARLQYRHSDNIVGIFLRFLDEVQLPEIFRFEFVDLYEKKNIPKVIYCIHALSWLLFRKGMVTFRIGNLVGKLQFEDHELEAMQKGLDKSGVSMPNFSGMSASFGEEPEPEPEPMESEEERLDRELAENEAAILDLQAQVRGAMVRLRLGSLMQGLWGFEEKELVDLQSRIRGDFSRQIAEYRLSRRRFAVNLQSAARGFATRSRQRGKEEFWQDKKKEVVTIQSLVRARMARAEVKHTKSRIQVHESGIRHFQAAIRAASQRKIVETQLQDTQKAEVGVNGFQAAVRGALARKRFDDLYGELMENEASIAAFQTLSLVRGLLLRQGQRTQEAGLRQHEETVSIFQSATRGLLSRKQASNVQTSLASAKHNWTQLQAMLRGRRCRDSFGELKTALQSCDVEVTSLQSVERGSQCRQKVSAILGALSDQEASIAQLEACIRGFLFRNEYSTTLSALDGQAFSIVDFQAASRGWLQRERTYNIMCALQDHEEQITNIQSHMRTQQLCAELGTLLTRLEDQEDAVSELQTLARGKIVRTQFVEKRKFYKENMEKVVKIQSFVRGRQQGEAYKSLTSGKNPPVGTVKNFVHLLNDSDFDFDEEMEFERLRKTVVQSVRQNEMTEQYIDQLEIKIALLVKNKITLDELVKHQKHFGGHVGNLLTNKEIASKDPFDLKALNKNSRKKLEHYQQLFFILQTQPQYLARIFKKVRLQGTTEKDCKRIEQLMMGLFGFAQKRREEYYLLKLISRSIKEEIDDCSSLQDYLRGSYFWNKILAAYVRSPRDRKFLRDLLGPVIKEYIMEAEGLDLESDPKQIYRSAINNEELRTGQRSRRNPDVPREQAIQDAETRETFIHHLQDLREICNQFFCSMEEVQNRLPYGMRYIAQQTFELLCAKFPSEDQHHILQIVGNWIWRNYLQPALVQPETWGVIDRGLSPLQKRNLGEVSKVLSQVAAGRLFGGENIYLSPLNGYLTEAIERADEIWINLISIRPAEAHFNIDEFNDLYNTQKPTLYIKLADIFAIHQLIASDLPSICPTQDDVVLREVVRELGSAKNNENELLGVSSAEISLTLNPKLHDVEDPNAPIKALFMETKRCVLYIIRIQTGPDLLSIMVKPITDDDEDRWAALIKEELTLHDTNKRSAYTDTASSLLDITTLNYTDLKRTALENILTLEQAHRISRHNHYQDLLNEIALDIRSKHRRRVQRTQEIESVKATLTALDTKAAYLDQQLKSYNDYIEQAMVTLQSKKGKKRFLLPFTKQYNHERDLQRRGVVPRFGSFKYSARALYDKGVVAGWPGYLDRERGWDKINITISSDEVGHFRFEGSIGSIEIPGADSCLPLDDLLQAQFENRQFINLFGPEEENTGPVGALRLNVNLLLHLVFKKFYRDGDR
ncbi:ras GTPase activating protein-like protein [Saccharata proteae CBS 121410]|uniref:Ras GTPase activating protein-like protein n=1 Tax=Saccharata proteae CBS 121410 TaxID=1314787 RepID=A0A9P4M1L1_9PEZI|nr:ras GTPase activating protein-like protein [Saccharata proteae CBS 121410]